jgi:predicted DNA-binding transcriptional regulator AlpA
MAVKPEDLITARQIAAYAGVSTQAVYLWSQANDFPDPWVPGYWQWRAVEKWLRAHNKDLPA